MHHSHFVRLGRQRKRLLQAWYGVGVAVAAALALTAMLMLCREAWAGLADLVRYRLAPPHALNLSSPYGLHVKSTAGCGGWAKWYMVSNIDVYASRAFTSTLQW